MKLFIFMLNYEVSNVHKWIRNRASLTTCQWTLGPGWSGKHVWWSCGLVLGVSWHFLSLMSPPPFLPVLIKVGIYKNCSQSSHDKWVKPAPLNSDFDKLKLWKIEENQYSEVVVYWIWSRINDVITQHQPGRGSPWTAHQYCPTLYNGKAIRASSSILLLMETSSLWDGVR